jgi:hypothetical protein
MRLLLKNEADCLIRQHKPRDRPLPDLQRRTAAPYRASGFVPRPRTELRLVSADVRSVHQSGLAQCACSQLEAAAGFTAMRFFILGIAFSSRTRQKPRRTSLNSLDPHRRGNSRS